MVRAGAVVRVLILCGLSLTTMAFAKTNNNKTIVTYPDLRSFAAGCRYAGRAFHVSTSGDA